MEDRKAQGLPTPALDNRPVLQKGLDFYLIAYQDLLYDRTIGMSVGPIPWSSVDRWAERHGVKGLEEFSILLGHIRALEKAKKDFDDSEEGKETQRVLK